MDKIVKNYEDACNKLAEYIANNFLQQRDWYWVGDEVGGVADFGDIDFLTPMEMRLIITNRLKYEDYAAWRDAIVDNSDKGVVINLQSWIKGLRYEQLERKED